MNNEPRDRIKEVTFDELAHIELLKGADIMRKAVGKTYGPGGRNVLIKKKYVHPITTKDGVTVAREIGGYGNKLPSQIQNEAAKLIYQASEKTNKTAGDGTTATVVLLTDLYKAGYKLVTAGEDPMVLKRKLDADRRKVVEFVESKSVKCTKEKLKQVAVISSGDEGLGEMISDLVWNTGADGAITINYHNAPNIQIEKVTGYLFDSGFKNLAAEVEFEAPLVLVTQKRLSTKTDMIPILELMSAAQKQFIIVGDVAGAALDTLMWAISNQKADGLSIPPPAFGADGHDFFVDIATYTGSHLVLESDSFKDITLDDFGTIKGARVTRDKAILFGDNSTGDDIAERIKTIKNQLKQTDVTPSLKEQLDLRLAKLAGKVSIIKVGAATEAERETLFFQVEDAVEASKSALSSGIVAGGATTLLFASRLDLEPFVKDALQELFRLLLANAAEDGGYYLKEVLNSTYGQGFNLRNMTDKPIDLIESGVVDATKVVLQTVQNAFSIAAELLTVGATITEVEDEPVAKA